MSSHSKKLNIGAVSTLILTSLLLTSCATSSDTTEKPEPLASTNSVDHARGTSEVPVDPQRVVVLEPVELDTAVALGVTPVGAAVASNVAGVPEYLGVDGIAPVGTVPEPDLEAIAALKPDLILGTESRHSKLYDQLESIAPTVFMATQADPWQENVQLIAQALGKQEEAQDLLDNFNERCEDIKTEFNTSQKTANVIRPRDETTLSIYGPTSFAGGALECVGLTIPEQEWEDGGLQADISPENILSSKADYVFVTTLDVNDPSTIPNAITQNAAEFPAVTLVDTSYWISGVGPKGGELVLSDLEKFLSAQK